MSSLTVRELIARFETWAMKRLSSGTVLNYRRHLTRFANAVGDVPCDTLKSHHLIEWGTKWHEIQAVQRCWNWACNDAELIDRSPFARVKRPRMNGRKRIFSRAELMRFLRAAAADFRLYLFAMRETIARPQEIRKLQWTDLRSCNPAEPLQDALHRGTAYFEVHDFKARHLRRDPDSVRIIPCTRRLGRMLLRLANRTMLVGGEIFCTSRGRAWTKEAVRLRMKRLRKSLGTLKDKRGESLVCYSIRHTSATLAVAQGIRDRILAELMGHTTTRTTARYQHLEVAHLVDAMGRLGNQRRPACPD